MTRFVGKRHGLPMQVWSAWRMCGLVRMRSTVVLAESRAGDVSATRDEILVFLQGTSTTQLHRLTKREDLTEVLVYIKIIIQQCSCPPCASHSTCVSKITGFSPFRYCTETSSIQWNICDNIQR